MEIAVYKLINGEDVIGMIAEKTDIGVFLTNPVSYITMPNYGFQMKDWMILTEEDTVFLPFKHIMVDMGKLNEFGLHCYMSFTQARNSQKKYLADSMTEEGPKEEIERHDMSDDVRDIWDSLDTAIRVDKTKMH